MRLYLPDFIGLPFFFPQPINNVEATKYSICSILYQPK